ncbi:MAG: [FeFe] hydrogenase H-cluster maturation GTPase HydF, partial [Planctomycetes bacterium]|nr:[FeFe] hydrogenase H-cluster maturation GTPase HydF [Planctomycetota bacterium]
EACSPHPTGGDTGRGKIRRWLKQCGGGELPSDTARGHDSPEALGVYSLVVHCGGCMWNRREMLTRMLRCRAAGVPITNYGVAIAFSLGIFARALSPFPAALEAAKATDQQPTANKEQPTAK